MLAEIGPLFMDDPIVRHSSVEFYDDAVILFSN